MYANRTVLFAIGATIITGTMVGTLARTFEMTNLAELSAFDSLDNQTLPALVGEQVSVNSRPAKAGSHVAINPQPLPPWRR